MTALLRRLVARAANLLRWRRLDEDLHAEMDFHLEQSARAHEANGVSAAEARRLAVRDFGGVDRWTESSRDTRGVPWVQDAARDTRYAVRALRRTPGFAAAAIGVLALGIGSTVAVFSVVRGVLLAPLPYEDPSSLHVFFEADNTTNIRVPSYPTFLDIAAATQVGQLTYARGETVAARGADGTMNLLGAFVSTGFFDVLGREAQYGRVLSNADARQPVAVLSERVAQRLFGNAKSALGETLRTPAATYTVVGVMPAGFAFPAWADLWLPIESLAGDAAFALEQRNLHIDSMVLLRTAPGVSAEQAAVELGGLVARFDELYPEQGVRFDRANIRPLRDVVLGNIAPRFVIVLGSVVLVLIIACVNMASLLLARGLARRGELAVRGALGAGRGRLLRQLLTESAVLAALGGAIGTLGAWAAVTWLRANPPQLLPRVEEITLDGNALLFALGISVACALLFGAAPALKATSGWADALRAGGRSLGGDIVAVRMRGALVVAQVALAVMLLIGASLLLRTAHALSEQGLGFEPDGLAAIRLVPPDEYQDSSLTVALFEELRAAAAAVPGVQHAALANHIPLGGPWMTSNVRTSRQVPAGEASWAVFRTVSPSYLQVLGVQLRAGELFDERNIHGDGVVVNRTLAEREWPDANAIGREILLYRSAQGRPGFGEPLPSRVIGVIDDVAEFGPDNPAPATVYVPYTRDVWPSFFLVVRGPEIAGALPALARALQQVQPDIPVAGPSFLNELHTMDEYRANWVQLRTFVTTLLLYFAAVAVTLALVGLFAVMAFVVAQRRGEIAVRMALGAQPLDASRMVLLQATKLVTIGLLAGVLAAIPGTRLVESLLFGVERNEPAVYLAAVIGFAVTALIAAYIPARRAARVQPLSVLRG